MHTRLTCYDVFVHFYLIMAAVTHAQIVAGKLEAIRLQFEWEDGTFHVFKQRKRLPKLGSQGCAWKKFTHKQASMNGMFFPYASF